MIQRAPARGPGGQGARAVPGQTRPKVSVGGGHVAIALRTPGEIDAIARAGAAATGVLGALARLARPGVAELELDAAARDLIAAAGARPVFEDEPGPDGRPHAATVCLGPHGRPTGRRLSDGEWLLLDVGLRLDGWCADVATTVLIGPAQSVDDGPGLAARRATRAALAACAPGEPWGLAADAAVASAKPWAIVAGRDGHGIGRRLHEPPRLGYAQGDRSRGQRLVAGMVLTIEPWLEGGPGGPACEEWMIAVTADGIRTLGGLVGDGDRTWWVGG